MKKRTLLFGTALLTAVIYDNEFRLSYDRYYHFPDVNHSKKRKEKDEVEGIAFVEKIPHETMTIQNDLGSTLYATFIPSKQPSNQYVIFSHGYRNYGLREFGMMIEFYYNLHVNLLFLDHQAHGKSEGRYITFGYQESKDLLQWMDVLLEKYGQNIKLYLHGISMGAATVLHASRHAPTQVQAILSDCAYISPKDQLCHTMASYHVPFRTITYQTITKRLNYLMKSNIDEVNNIEAVKQWRKPIYFVHGKEDHFVPVQNGMDLYHACASEDKKILLVEQAHHAQSYRINPTSYQKLIQEMLEI